MSPLQALILGILQGATEFLPVSSSAHLVLVPHWLGWPEPGLTFDVFLHLGTMVAVLIYFRREWIPLIKAGWAILRDRRVETPETRLAWALILGTIPAALVGVFFEDQVEALFSAPQITGAFLLGTAAVLMIPEWLPRRERPLTTLNTADALIIGLGQALAVLPGLSRSGTTLSAGRMRGFSRPDAARFAFLLSVPIIMGTGGYALLKTARHGLDFSQGLPILLGFVAAAITGYAVIAGFLALVRRQNLWPFALYCAIIGTLVVTGLLG